MMNQYPQIVAESPDGKNERITLKIMGIRDESRYNKFIAEGQEYIEKQYGDTVSDDRTQDENILANRARIFASLKQYETQEGDGEWQPAEIPADYVNVETFIDCFPRRLYSTCAYAAMQLNWPQFIIGDSEKKGLSATVSWLMG